MKAQAADEGPGLMAALFILGFVVLAFEIFITRIASGYLTYHFAFLALSLTMLAFFLSGAHYLRQDGDGRSEWAKGMSLALPLSLIVFALMARIWPFTVFLPPFAGFAGFVALFSASYLTLYHLDRSKAASSSYASNLLGNGSGALFAVISMGSFTPFHGMLACALVSTALPLVGRGPQKRGAGLFIPALIVAIFASLALLSLDWNSENVMWERWNSFSYITVRNVSGPVLWGSGAGEEPASYLMQIDSNAATALLPEGDPDGVIARDITHFGYHLLGRNASVAIIGSGGGRDAIGAVEAGAGRVLAIEINPAIIEGARIFAPYENPGVELVQGDGREVVPESGERFDMIQLSLVDTWAAVSSGTFALTENYLYTREAAVSFMDALKSGGMLSITYWGATMPRIVAIAESALAALGVDDAAAHMLLVEAKDSDGATVSTLLVKREPFTEAERENAARIAAGLGFVIRDAVPGGERAATDDSPFVFFNMGGAGFLFIVFVALVGAGLAAMRLAGRKAKAEWLHGGAFFALIGMGYMAVETTFLQRLLLLLHDPTLTIALVFSSFLIFSAAGSLASGFSAMRKAALLLPLVLVLLALFWQDIVFAASGLAPGGAILLSIAAIAVPAFLMGIFFPSGFERMRKVAPGSEGFVWAVNGFASVLAPVLSLASAITLGFTASLLIAAALYACACSFRKLL
ncbi:MAG: hypothetical protein AB1529_05625 [Candidatus Micrarchaeota archaeon]